MAMGDIAEIGGPGRLGPTRPDGARTGSAGFSVATPAYDATPAAAGAVPALALESLLALQATTPEAERDRTARRHGQALLTALSALQRCSLADQGTEDAAARLDALMRDVPAAADPGLAAVLRAIRLRTRVELARLGG
jgi:hypothetical protein